MRDLPCLVQLPTAAMSAAFALALALATAAIPASATAAPSVAYPAISRGDAMDLKHDIAGHYRLDTGRDVRLTLIEDRLYLDLNRHYRRELQPVADRLLASRDGRLTVEYMPDGPVERILIRHPGLPSGTRLGEASWRGR